MYQCMLLPRYFSRVFVCSMYTLLTLAYRGIWFFLYASFFPCFCVSVYNGDICNLKLESSSESFCWFWVLFMAVTLYVNSVWLPEGPQCHHTSHQQSRNQWKSWFYFAGVFCLFCFVFWNERVICSGSFASLYAINFVVLLNSSPNIILKWQGVCKVQKLVRDVGLLLIMPIF